MNAAADIYVGEDDSEDGELEVERPGGTVGIHLRVKGVIVASAFLDQFQLGVLVGQLSRAGVEEGVEA